jgi:hypothetical protein
LPWSDGTFVDPMHLSNLLVRSVWIKDALVTRLNSDPHLSVFVQCDWKRIKKDVVFAERVRMGVAPEQAVRPLIEAAIATAEDLAGITPRLSRDRIYVLEHSLERTPTHKIKFISELKRLDTKRWL